ncbi:hypothetical protein MMC13_004700 [Lambiella insularis]|nr:hypothetical protein [Lambiella insularis]
MSKQHGGSHSLHKYATARGARSSSSLTQQDISHSNKILMNLTPSVGDSPNKQHDHNLPRTHALADDNSSFKTSGDNEGGESDASAEDTEEDGDDDDDNDEPEAFAPSELLVKFESFQTGRTLTGPETRILGIDKKRRLSGSSDEGDRFRRPAKARRYNHSYIDSNTITDDEDYNAVDLISDSDEGDPTLEKMEEKMIIDSEEENADTFVSQGVPPRPRSTSSEDWQGFQLPETLLLDEIPFFQEQLERTDPDAVAGAFSLCDSAPPLRYPLSPSPPAARRVRFVEEVSRGADRTSSSTPSVDRQIFPDLFMQQDSLDPSFRSLLESDNIDENHSVTDGEGSHWDLDDNEDFELEKHGLDDYGSSDGGSSSGYESDEGETTDEEVLPPKTVNRPQALLRLHSASSLRSPVTPKATTMSTRKGPLTPTPAMRRQGPSMASWVVDPTKPIAVIDNTGKTMLIYPAPRSVRKTAAGFVSSLSSSTTTSPKTSFAGLASAFGDSEVDRSDLSSQEPSNPVFKTGANLMFSGLLHGGPGMEHVLGGQALGPPEAFYPFHSIDADGFVFDADEFDEDDDDDDPEHTLNLQDFIDFGDDSSDSDADDINNSRLSAVTSPVVETSRLKSTPTRGGSQSISTQSLLQHFDRGVVSSFRRNQARHQSLLRRPPSNNTMSGIKGGRLFVANNSISPLRKRKVGHNLNVATNPFRGITATRRVTNKMHKREKNGC